ncbi:hypothetical protein GCM10019016_083140 [Streptomyces prasinosporus]|uniref:Uncharacterized protein n=1 Tax=Streptomyces prasinosporus TaxID=68256 RepID=A0ABP6U3B9_9ACTN
MRATTSSVPAGASMDGSSGPPVAPATSSSASGPVSTRPPSNGVGQHLPGARPARVAEAHDEVPGQRHARTPARPARRATSIHTTDSRIGSPRRRRSTSCSSEDSSRR